MPAGGGNSVKNVLRGALVAGTAVLSSLWSSPSHALTIDFSFINTIGNVSGTVSGEIEGLVDTGFSSATNVIIQSAPGSLGLTLPLDILSTPAGTLTLDRANGFITTGGVITGGALVITENYTLPDFTPENWAFCLSVSVGYCSSSPSGAYLTNGSGGLEVATDVSPTFTTAATPLPAGLPLFATGLGALGLLGWRRKRKASAAFAT